MPGKAEPTEITLEFLDAFAAAWNRHDVDAIMAAMTEDCIFEASAGVGVKGTVYDGQRQVRKGVEMVFAQFSDARWSGPKHFIAGNRGVTEWVFSRTRDDGRSRRGSGLVTCSRSETARSRSRTPTGSSRSGY